MESKASGGVDARVTERDVSKATRQSNSRRPGMGEIGNVCQPRPDTSDARDNRWPGVVRSDGGGIAGVGERMAGDTSPG